MSLPDGTRTSAADPMEKPDPRRHRTLTTLAWTSASMTLFGGMQLLTRLAGPGIPWPMMGAVRAAIGALVAFGVARATSAPLVLVGSRALWLRSAFGTIAVLLTFYVLGSPKIPLGDAVAIFNLSP